MRTQTLACLLGLFLLALAGFRAGADVVYDNSVNVDRKAGSRTTLEHGDEILLVPGNWSLTSFSFDYFGDFKPAAAPAASAVLRLYANDGTDAIDGPSTALRPSSLLWESSAAKLATNFNALEFALPQVSVPNRFTWTVQFLGLADAVGNSATLVLANPVSVGGVLPTKDGVGVVGSYGDYWQKDPVGAQKVWTLHVLGNNVKANFVAQVQAAGTPAGISSISVVDGEVIIQFAGGTLQAANVLGASFQDVAATGGEYRAPATGAQQYFRVR
jgi:hypothetical protein